jgi:hypothetical protein
MCRLPARAPRALLPFLPAPSTLALVPAVLLATLPGAGAPEARAADVVTLSVADARVAEGDAGLGSMVFEVRLSGPAPADLVVHYGVESGSAQVGSDYLPGEASLILPGQSTLALIVIPVVGDTLLEANETFRLRLLAVEGAAFADSVAVGTILNDERTTFTPGPPTGVFHPGLLPLAFADQDGDGDDDLPLYEHYTFQGFRERDGFRDLIGEDNFHGGAWGDYDRDGDPDLVLLPYPLTAEDSSRCRLFRNDGGVLTDVAAELGLNLYGHGETPVWADFDGDGWPDLFAPYYSYVEPHRSFLYFNQGDGTFREAGVEAGVAMIGWPESLKPEGSHAVDWDDDGDLDLYCASHLWLNDGTGTFTDVREAVGLPAVFDEGSEFVDFDNDGDFDLYLRTIEAPLLYRNDGGTYVEVAAAVGLPLTTVAWGDRWADVDNDGDLDLLYVAPGFHVRLVLNAGDGTFAPDPAFDALQLFGFLSAFADVDVDGDLDFALVGARTQILINRLENVAGAAESYLRVIALDDRGHRNAFGTTVRVRQPDAPEMGVQTRVVDGGSAYLTQSEYPLTFGGMINGPWEVEVRYPVRGGSRIVLDALNTPILGALEQVFPESRTIAVHPDGRVDLVLPYGGSIDAGAARAARDGEDAAFFTSVLPSPARSVARFSAALRRPGRLEIRIHDVAGRAVRTLVPAAAEAGAAHAAWDLTDAARRRVPPGVYFASLAWNGRVGDRRKIVVAP